MEQVIVKIQVCMCMLDLKEAKRDCDKLLEVSFHSQHRISLHHRMWIYLAVISLKTHLGDRESLKEVVELHFETLDLMTSASYERERGRPTTTKVTPAVLAMAFLGRNSMAADLVLTMLVSLRGRLGERGRKRGTEREVGGPRNNRLRVKEKEKERQRET